MNAVAESSTVSPALAANDALARGNLQLADYLCRDALRADPHDALAMTLLGHMASGLRRWQLAEAWFARALALQLARDPARLASLKAHLRATQATSALCDADAFTRNLEAIYTAMWRKTQLAGASDALTGAAA